MLRSIVRVCGWRRLLVCGQIHGGIVQLLPEGADLPVLNLTRIPHSMVAQPSRLRVSACSAVRPIASETLAPRGFGEACEKGGLKPGSYPWPSL
jgi:hypothetical protein